MGSVRAQTTRTFRTKVLLPGGLLAVAAMASLAMLIPGAAAAGHSDSSSVDISPDQVTTKAC